MEVAKAIARASPRNKGLGAIGHCVEVSVDRRTGLRYITKFDPAVFTGVSARYCRGVESADRATQTLPRHVQDHIYFPPDIITTASAVYGHPGEDVHKYFPMWGEIWAPNVKDAIGLFAHDGELSLAQFSLPQRKPTILTSRERTLWTRIAVHLGTAYRLRKAQMSIDAADGIFASNGRLEHVAHPSLDAALRRGHAGRTRGRALRASPESALEIWQGLVDGRWSLVDYIDTDGKAFVLAVRNEPGARVSSKMTSRQRAVAALAALGYGNKQIAYALGVSTAAVGMLLVRACRSTGAVSRHELVRAVTRTMSSTNE